MGSTLHTFVAFSACFYAFTKYNNREEKKERRRGKTGITKTQNAGKLL